MNDYVQHLMTKAGIDVSYVKNTKQIILLEKFAELIALECAAACGSQADKKNIRKLFGLPIESNVKYKGPDAHGSITSQYTREYNLPRENK